MINSEFPGDCDSKRILKIGQNLMKTMCRISWLTFWLTLYIEVETLLTASVLTDSFIGKRLPQFIMNLETSPNPQLLFA